MKLTTKNFSSAAVTIGAMHYFPTSDDLNHIVDGKVSMSVCYYSRSRRKWLSDIAYLSEKQASFIVSYATKRGVLIKGSETLKSAA